MASTFVPSVLLALLLLGPGLADAQTVTDPAGGVERPSGIDGTTLPEPREALPTPIRLRGFHFTHVAEEVAFFEREHLGFDTGTVRAVGRDLLDAARQLRRSVSEITALSGEQLALRLLPWLILAVLLFGLVLVDIRTRRATKRVAAARLERASVRPRLRGVEASLLRALGQLAAPAIALGLSVFPVRGLFDSAPWTLVLTRALTIAFAYRAFATALSEVLCVRLVALDADAARKVYRVLLLGARVAALVLVAQAIVDGFAYRPDVTRFLDFLFRATLASTGAGMLLLRRKLLALLPEEGSRSYLAFRRAVERFLGVFLIASAALLALYALGFRRATTTILLRSYALIALITAGALVQRWIERREEVGTPAQRSLVLAIRRRIDGFMRLVAWVVLLVVSLSVLGIWKPVASLLATPLAYVGQSPLSLYHLLEAVSIVSLAVVASRALRVVLEEVVFPRRKLDIGVGYAIVTTVHYFLLFLGIGLALVALGLDLSALAVFAGALGVGIGLGLQDVTRNLVSGFILLFGGSVKKGDLVTVNDKYFGRVSAIGTRSVTVRTNDWSELVIPSNDLVNSTIINWTRTTPEIRLHVPVGVSYKSDVNVVREALLEAAGRFEGRSRAHPPDVWLKGFGDSSVDFELLLWIDASAQPRDEAMGKILFHVWDVLRERGIEIPFPQRDVHVRTVLDADTVSRVRKG